MVSRRAPPPGVRQSVAVRRRSAQRESEHDPRIEINSLDIAPQSPRTTSGIRQGCWRNRAGPSSDPRRPGQRRRWRRTVRCPICRRARRAPATPRPSRAPDSKPSHDEAATLRAWRNHARSRRRRARISATTFGENRLSRAASRPFGNDPSRATALAIGAAVAICREHRCDALTRLKWR